MSRSLLSFLSFCLLASLASAQTANLNNSLQSSTLYSFESPTTPGAGYIYNPPLSASQPWVWPPALGGIASQGSPFDPPGANTPPQNVQYAFIQTSPNNGAGNRTSSMSAQLTVPSTTATFYASFYVGVRLGGATGEVTPNVTASQVTLTYGSQTLWTSVANISDSSGYLFVQTDPFTPAAATAQLTFTVVSLVDLDHSILIDAVQVVPTVAQPNATLAVGLTNNFEFPAVPSRLYDYNTPVSPFQPWVWTQGQGGRAGIGSPFDPPPPTTPPSGSQYAFLQTSPNGNSATSASMTGIITGLSAVNSYFVSFYWALRAQQNTAGGDVGAGNQTQSSFTVLVNGQVVYASANNLTDAGGWIYTQTSAWQPVALSNGQATVQFLVQSTTTQDHTVLFDDILISLAGAIPVPTLSDFESPNTGAWVYTPPVTVQQPWTFTANRCGIAHAGSPWDPPPPAQPPSNGQYAFLQTSGVNNVSMSATLFNLTTGVNYAVSFYYAVRYNNGLNQTESQLTLSIGGAAVWVSPPNISDVGGWTYVPPIAFTGSGSVPVQFSVLALFTADRAVLVDAVQFTSDQPVPTYYMYPSVTYDFENPNLALSVPYNYNPVNSLLQPFTWPIVKTNVINGGGGVAATGSPWDPPPPVTPPAGRQYAFIQTSANSLSGLSLSNMTAIAQLSGNQNYYITFSYGARKQSNDEVEPGWQTQSTLTVTVNGLTVWTSGPNITDLGGWTPATTNTFPGVQGPDAIAFIVQSSTNDDHAILVDTITIRPGTAPAPGSSTGGGAPQYPPIVFTPGGIIVPDTLYDFETPFTAYTYNPNITSTPAQPWSFAVNPTATAATDPGLGGVAATNSPFDPPPPTRAPNNVQYAFVQTSPNGDFGTQSSYMTAVLTGLTANSQYTLQFYWAIRADKTVSDTTAGNVTQSLYSVSFASTVIYTSPQNLVDAGGWAQVSVPFTPSVTTGNLIFNVTSLANQDHSILFDAVIIRSAAGPAAAFVQAATTYGFEYPNLSLGSQVNYYYNPMQVESVQPWTWFVQPGTFNALGGVALVGSPFDPPPPTTPPSGQQYGFIQVTPLNGVLTSYMTANVTALTGGANYYVSFYWAVRAQIVGNETAGNVTTATLTVTIGGTTIFTLANPSDAGGWSLVNSNTFTAPSGVTQLTFTVVATASEDHSILFDSVQVIQGTSPGGGGPITVSSTGSVAPSTAPPSATSTVGVTSAVTPTSTPSPTPSTATPTPTSSPAAGGGTTGVGASSSGSSGLSGGAIAGIVIGSVVGALIICVVLFLLCSGSRRGKKAAREDGSTEASRNTARWEQQEEGVGETHHTNEGDEVEMQ